MLTQLLFPATLNIHSIQLVSETTMLTVEANSVQTTACCPDCWFNSKRIHSRYQRQVADLPLAGQSVTVSLQVRRYFCDNPACARRTFVERLPDFVAPFARRSRRLAEQQRQTGLALGGEAGIRLLQRLVMPTSGDTLLRLIRTTPLSTNPTPRVLGLDDWAWSKGQRYGTILVDLERHEPVDLLPDRSAATVTSWLQAHPDVEIISRDRAQNYIEGITQGAPTATQVADRWHLMKNWRETLEHLLTRQPACLTAAASPEPLVVPGPTEPPQEIVKPEPNPTVSLPKAEQQRQATHQRRLARYQQVLDLHQQGLAQKSIAQRLGLSTKTTRRYLQAGHLPEITRQRQPGVLAPYLDYLQARWQVGCHNGAQLLREIKELGYPGGQTTVADWVAAQRKQLNAQQQGGQFHKRPWSARAVAWLLVKPSEKLKPEEKATVERVLQASDPVSRAYHFGQAFLRLVRQRYHKALGPWLTAALESDIIDLLGSTELPSIIKITVRSGARVR
jgi:transposase